MIVQRVHAATRAMHPAQSWRDGWDDAANRRPFGHTQNGYSTVRGDSASELYYFDGFNNASLNGFRSYK